MALGPELWNHEPACALKREEISPPSQDSGWAGLGMKPKNFGWSIRTRCEKIVMASWTTDSIGCGASGRACWRSAVVAEEVSVRMGFWESSWRSWWKMEAMSGRMATMSLFSFMIDS